MTSQMLNRHFNYIKLSLFTTEYINVGNNTFSYSFFYIQIYYCRHYIMSSLHKHFSVSHTLSLWNHHEEYHLLRNSCPDTWKTSTVSKFLISFHLTVVSSSDCGQWNSTSVPKIFSYPTKKGQDQCLSNRHCKRWFEPLLLSSGHIYTHTKTSQSIFIFQ